MFQLTWLAALWVCVISLYICDYLFMYMSVRTMTLSFFLSRVTSRLSAYTLHFLPMHRNIAVRFLTGWLCDWDIPCSLETMYAELLAQFCSVSPTGTKVIDAGFASVGICAPSFVNFLDAIFLEVCCKDVSSHLCDLYVWLPFPADRGIVRICDTCAAVYVIPRPGMDFPVLACVWA